MRRDTYNDYITGMEAVSNGSPWCCEILKRLLKRSGFLQVSNARILIEHPYNVDARIYRIVFSSSAWTGRK